MNAVSINAFLQWWAAGYREIIPVVPPDAPLSESSYIARNKAAGKAPGIRYASGLWGGLPGWREIVATEDDVQRWGEMGASVGLRRGQAFMLDIDALDPRVADEIEADALAILGPAPCRVGRAPKRGLLYRADGEIPNVKLIFDGPDGPNQIEVPNQAVLQGVHPGTRRPYAWPRKPVAFDQLSTVTLEKFHAFMEAQRKKLPNAKKEQRLGAGERGRVSQDSLKGRPELIKSLMATLPNTRELFPTYDDMVEVGEALHAASRDFPDLGNDLWHDWCSRWEGGDYDREQTEARWQTFDHVHAIGAKWLYEKADALGIRHEGSSFFASHHFDILPDEPESPFREAELNASREERAKRFELISFSAAAASAMTDPAPPLIKGLIDQGTMSVLYGDSNVGKTFVAMDMAYHVATGGSYAGMKTERGLVVYVASEGGRGAKRRLTALRDKYAPKEEPDFLLLPAAVDLRRPDVDLNPFIAALRALGRPIALIVIDTLSRALAGGDENSSVDMGALVKHFDAVRAATGAHLMIVHHTGKDRAKGARGHTLLRAATDTEIEVGEGLIVVTKQRDLDKSWTSAFRLEVRTVGMDSDGDRVTSCTVRLDGVTTVRRGEPTEGEAAVLAAIDVLSETAGRPQDGARTSDLEVWCKANLSGMTRDALNSHLRGLRAKRLIDQPKRGFWASTHSVLAKLSDETSGDLCEKCVDGIFS